MISEWIFDWAQPASDRLLLGRSDCEDIAIAKMWLLNATGVDLSNICVS
jgi:predicted transglutaminase-like cysteine proteinase